MFKRFFLLLTVMVMTSCGMSVVYYRLKGKTLCLGIDIL